MPADDIRKLAQEAVELAGRATPGPWEYDVADDCVVGPADCLAAPVLLDSFDATPADGMLTAHAGTHYATIARALLEALDERDEARRAHSVAIAQRDSAEAKVRYYEGAMCSSQRVAIHGSDTLGYTVEAARVSEVLADRDQLLSSLVTITNEFEDYRKQLLEALPHALGSCGCEVIVEERDHGIVKTHLLRGMPEQHDAAIEWLRGRIG